MIGGTTPRSTEAPSGSNSAQVRQSRMSGVRVTVMANTPSTATTSPANCSARSGSCSSSTATATESSGDRLPSAPVTTGPSARLDANVSIVRAAGNTRPTAAKIGTARHSMVWPCSRKGDSRMNTMVNDGTLIAAPDSGWIYRRPNCVSTSPPPRNTADAMPRMMAAVISRLSPIVRTLANPRAGL